LRDTPFSDPHDAGTQQGRVFQEIARALLFGTFSPGQSISVQMLCRQFEASTMPVRDSVARLVGLGALDFSPNCPLRVPHFTRAEFEELYTTRAALEAELAARAAIYCADETPARLNQELAELDAALERGDIAASLDHNVRLHFLLYSQSRSRLALPFVEALWLRMGPLQRVPLELAGARRAEFLRARRHHERLAEAIARRDGSAASRAMRNIIESSRRWYIKHYAFADPETAPPRPGSPYLLPAAMRSPLSAPVEADRTAAWPD
jgi:DNA-binding GntR family transcriptional regulator